MGTLADLELSSDDIEGACEELALTMGPEIGAADVLNAARELAGGARDNASMGRAVAQLVELSGGYADDGLLTDGHRRWPCDTPEKVSRSWRELHRERHRYSAADLATARQALMDAAAGFGFTLNDPDGPGLSPDGTPLSGEMLDDWGHSVQSYYDYNQGPGGMAAPTIRTARDIAQSFVRTYSPEWYRQQELAAAASVRYDPANPDHLALAANGVADPWVEDEILRLSANNAATPGPRRPPQMTTERAESEAVRLTSALYAREHPQRRDVTRRPPAEQASRDRDQRRKAIDDQLQLAHALAANPGSDEALRLSADMPSYSDAPAPPSGSAPVDPRVAQYMRMWNGANSTKAQARHAVTGRFGGGVISQGQGNSQSGLASLDDATVLDLQEMVRQWSAAVGELRGYSPNESYAPLSPAARQAAEAAARPGHT